MKRLLCASILIVVLADVSVDGREERSKVSGYTTKYDNVDLNAILKNERILRNYVDCCLGKKKCTSDGEVLKGHIKDAIENECDKCSEVQKKSVRKVGKAIYQKYPQWWKELCDHFDPQGQYQKRYEKFIKDALAAED
uniref:Chemosensory protein 07 n=1 Tax=Chrysomela lapponica TaxID=153811 RepID=A0A310S6B7_CHRLA